MKKCWEQMKEWWKKPWVVPTVIGGLVFIGFIVVACLTEIEHAFDIFAVIGGIYGLWLAANRGKIADKQAEAAIEQTELARRSNLAQTYVRASEMIWHPNEVGIRESGLNALGVIGEYDHDYAIEIQSLIVSFIRHSSPTPNQKKSKQERMFRDDILAANYTLSSLYSNWFQMEDRHDIGSFSLRKIPAWFWGWREDEPPLWRNYSNANFSHADLRNAKLSTATLFCADFSDAKLSGADLSKAALDGVNFSGACLSGACLSGAIFGSLIGANFTKADFRGDGSEGQAAKGLTKAQIGSAFWDRDLGSPLFPEYLEVDVDKMRAPPKNRIMECFTRIDNEE